MKYLMIIISITFCCSLSSAKLVKGKSAQLKALHSQCMSTGAYGKMITPCDCISKRIKSKMDAAQINHIYLVNNGKRNESRLPVEEASIVEEFEAIISAQCLGQPDIKVEAE